MISAGVNITKKLLSALEFDNYKKITYNQVLFFIVTSNNISKATNRQRILLIFDIIGITNLRQIFSHLQKIEIVYILIESWNPRLRSDLWLR